MTKSINQLRRHAFSPEVHPYPLKVLEAERLAERLIFIAFLAYVTVPLFVVDFLFDYFFQHVSLLQRKPIRYLDLIRVGTPMNILGMIYGCNSIPDNKTTDFTFPVCHVNHPGARRNRAR